MFAVRILTLILVIGVGFSFPHNFIRVEHPDASSDIAVIPLNGKPGDDNLLSAVGAVTGLKESEFGSATGGVQLENIAGEGHSLSVLEKHTPSLGDQLTAAGSLNLLDKGPHKLDSNAFITRTVPKSDPSYTSAGGNINYNYGDKGSLSLSGVHDPSGDQLKAEGSLHLLDKGPHRLDADAFISKDIPRSRPSFTNAEGSLLYNYGDKGSLSLSGIHNPSGDQLSAAGSLNLLDKGPHRLDADAFVTKHMPVNSDPFTSAGGSLGYKYGDKGSLLLSGVHNPSGDQLSAAGSLNLLDKGPHRLDANAFVTRHMPVNSDPFTTGGGSLSYKHGDTFGATLSGSNTGFSAMADANLIRGRDYSLKLSGGLTKSIGPYMPETGWQPTGLFTFRKSW